MACIKDRLRRRLTGFQKILDVIDLTDESAPVPARVIEIIDLTDCHVKIEPEKLDDFRQSLYAALRRRRKEAMSLLRLGRCVNLENKEKFSKKEIDAALFEMVECNEIFIANGLVHVI